MNKIADSIINQYSLIAIMLNATKIALDCKRSGAVDAKFEFDVLAPKGYPTKLSLSVICDLSGNTFKLNLKSNGKTFKKATVSGNELRNQVNLLVNDLQICKLSNYMTKFSRVGAYMRLCLKYKTNGFTLSGYIQQSSISIQAKRSSKLHVFSLIGGTHGVAPAQVHTNGVFSGLLQRPFEVEAFLK